MKKAGLFLIFILMVSMILVVVSAKKGTKEPKPPREPKPPKPPKTPKPPREPKPPKRGESSDPGTPYTADFWILEFSPGDYIQIGVTKEYAVGGGNSKGAEYVRRIDWYMILDPYNFTFTWMNDTNEWAATSRIWEANRGFDIDNDHSFSETTSDEKVTVAIMRATPSKIIPVSDPVDIYTRVWANDLINTGWEKARISYVGFSEIPAPTGSSAPSRPPRTRSWVWVFLVLFVVNSALNFNSMREKG